MLVLEDSPYIYIITIEILAFKDDVQLSSLHIFEDMMEDTNNLN